jgi:hypothetical protein
LAFSQKIGNFLISSDWPAEYTYLILILITMGKKYVKKCEKMPFDLFLNISAD